MVKKNILVTGAQGYVGRHLCAVLLERGIGVTGVGRRDPGKDAGSHADHTHLTMDMTANTDWSKWLSGTHAIVHLADGLNQFEGADKAPSPKQSDEIIAASVNLAKTAMKANVRTFIYVSSIKTMCGEHADSILTEEVPPAPVRVYGRFKLQLERMLQDLAEGSDMRLFIIRIPIVYGPDTKSNVARLAQLADTVWPLPVKGLSNRRSMISVANLCDALATLIDRADGADRTSHVGENIYIVDDGAALTLPQLIASLRLGLSRPARQFAIPSLFWKLARAMPLVGPIAARLSLPLEVSSKKFRTTFNWQPLETTGDALAKAAPTLRRK